jgi:tRNA(Ile2) C34 agmatinyltransferase TiaS
LVQGRCEGIKEAPKGLRGSYARLLFKNVGKIFESVAFVIPHRIGQRSQCTDYIGAKLVSNSSCGKKLIELSDIIVLNNWPPSHNVGTPLLE